MFPVKQVGRIGLPYLGYDPETCLGTLLETLRELCKDMKTARTRRTVV
jgi:hypothetical protein